MLDGQTAVDLCMQCAAAVEGASAAGLLVAKARERWEKTAEGSTVAFDNLGCCGVPALTCVHAASLLCFASAESCLFPHRQSQGKQQEFVWFCDRCNREELTSEPVMMTLVEPEDVVELRH